MGTTECRIVELQHFNAARDVCKDHQHVNRYAADPVRAEVCFLVTEEIFRLTMSFESDAHQPRQGRKSVAPGVARGIRFTHRMSAGGETDFLRICRPFGACRVVITKTPGFARGYTLSPLTGLEHNENESLVLREIFI